MTNMIYDVEVKGFEPPFSWCVYRTGTPGFPSRTQCAGCQGESSTFEDACFDARNAAEAYEADRKRNATVEIVPLFEVDSAPGPRPDEVPVLEKH